MTRNYSIFRDISNENLRFLSVEQALADIAHFTEHIKLESVTPGADITENGDIDIATK